MSLGKICDTVPTLSFQLQPYVAAFELWAYEPLEGDHAGHVIFSSLYAQSSQDSHCKLGFL